MKSNHNFFLTFFLNSIEDVESTKGYLQTQILISITKYILTNQLLIKIIYQIYFIFSLWSNIKVFIIIIVFTQNDSYFNRKINFVYSNFGMSNIYFSAWIICFFLNIFTQILGEKNNSFLFFEKYTKKHSTLGYFFIHWIPKMIW